MERQRTIFEVGMIDEKFEEYWDVDELLAAKLSPVQPTNNNLREYVDMTFDGQTRLAVVLFILSVIPDNDQYMSEDMQSRTFRGFLAVLRQLLPNLPKQVTRRVIEECLREIKLDNVTVRIGSMTIRDLSKISFGFHLFEEVSQVGLSDLLEDIKQNNPNTDLAHTEGTTENLGRFFYNLQRKLPIY